MTQYDMGLIGLAVMGENLAMNIESRGFSLSVYNREMDWTQRFVNGRGKGKNIHPAYSLKELVDSLKKPRIVMMMIQAGNPVDEVLTALIPLLQKGDVVIDGGNSNFEDTTRRCKLAQSHDIHFIGMGVSGGEEGALKGPSLMPGGSQGAWPLVQPILQAIAAKVKEDGEPCCEWIGPQGSGHFVKMIHNGIEYGDIQLICEVYQFMRDGLAMSHQEMAEVFNQWNRGPLNSYLIEITRDILAYEDEKGEPLVGKIVDSAGQKGTGKWTVFSALEEGVPLTLIGEAVFSRFLSAIKQERVTAAGILQGPNRRLDEGDQAMWIKALEEALLASKIVSYAQGFALMQAAAKSHGWALRYGAIASVWRGGCIIRSVFLEDIKKAFDEKEDLANLMLAPHFTKTLANAQQGWRHVCATGLTWGLPMPAMAAALTYYDGYRCQDLPANLLQAQRDYFGAHTYERIDAPRGTFFHTNWTGEGGDTASTTYTG